MSTPSPTAGEGVAPARGRSRLVLIGACVLVLAGAGVVAKRTLTRHPPETESAKRRRPAEQAVVDLDPFVLNLPDAAGDRWLRLRVALVVDDKELATLAGEGLAGAKLRDRLLAVLARVRPASLAAPDAKEALRAEIRDAAATVLGEPPFAPSGAEAAHSGSARILDVYFTEFLLQ